MIDTVSVNRMFLLMARQAAELQAREIVTGLPSEVLEEIQRLSLEDIERLARSCKTCMFNVRFDVEQIRAITRMRDEAASAYSLIASSKRA